MGRTRYEQGVCVCCGGKWRVRVIFPALRRSPHLYVSAWELQVICGRCNSGDCGGSYYEGRIVQCLTGRQD